MHAKATLETHSPGARLLVHGFKATSGAQLVMTSSSQEGLAAPRTPCACVCACTAVESSRKLV